MRIRCETCGKSYHYMRHDTCPRCGAYNRPPRDVQAGAYDTPADAYSDLYRLMRGNGRRVRIGPRSLALAAVLVCMIGLTLMQAYSRLYVNTSLEDPPLATKPAEEHALDLEPDASPDDEWREPKKLPEHRTVKPAGGSYRATGGDAALKDDGAAFAPGAAQAAPGDAGEADALPANAAEDAASKAASPSGEALAMPDITRRASTSYLQTGFEGAGGVALEVVCTGVVDDPSVHERLLPGEKCIFIHFNARVTDHTLSDYEFFQAPFVHDADGRGRRLPLFEAPEGYTYLDPDGLRYSGIDTMSGQLFYAVPEDCTQFTLTYGARDSDGEPQSLRLRV